MSLGVEKPGQAITVITGSHAYFTIIFNLKNIHYHLVNKAQKNLSCLVAI